MKLAIISPWAISESSIGGTERFVIDLATQLYNLGNDLTVFCLSGKSHVINGVQYKSLNILGGDKVADEYDLQTYADNATGPAFYRTWADYLENSIDVSEFDAIQLNSLLFVDAWMEKRRIFTIHTNQFEYRMDWGQERLDCLVSKIRSSLPAQTALVTPSQHYAQEYSRLFDRSVESIPHAIDISRLEPVSSLPLSSPQPGHEDNITLLLPSRLELVQKRPQIAFQGVALLPAELKKNITIVASGADKQYLENRTKLTKIAKDGGFRAVFGNYPSMGDAYAAADIVALPSKSESFGYAALESLQLGLPTILNGLPTFREIGHGNHNAHFFGHTAEAFSEVLADLLIDLKPRPIDPAWIARYDMGRWAAKYLELARLSVMHV
jgi:glycosyltransferase involved in cell wall biosynthesis